MFASVAEVVNLLQVAHERSSTELQAVCMEVAGECLPNVVVSLGQLSVYIALLTSTVLAAAIAVHKLAKQSTAQLAGSSSNIDSSIQVDKIRAFITTSYLFFCAGDCLLQSADSDSTRHGDELCE